jgi:hypothetical protein
MRVWLIGADKVGMEVLEQLAKNSDVEVVVSAQTDQPRAVREGLIAKVDFVERVTPANVNQLARRMRPDLILIDSAAGDPTLGRVTGGAALVDALNYEIAAASDYPCLVL